MGYRLILKCASDQMKCYELAKGVKWKLFPELLPAVAELQFFPLYNFKGDKIVDI